MSMDKERRHYHVFSRNFTKMYALFRTSPLFTLHELQNAISRNVRDNSRLFRMRCSDSKVIRVRESRKFSWKIEGTRVKEERQSQRRLDLCVIPRNGTPARSSVKQINFRQSEARRENARAAKEQPDSVINQSARWETKN